MNAGSELVAAIEAVWHEVQAKHPDTPDVIVVTGTGVQGRRNLHGSFWPDHWQGAGTERVHEMFLAGERFNDGVAGALSTILHEAAHGIANSRGVQDTSRQGRYHNLKFKATAEEVGLVVTQSQSHGWSDTALAIDVADYVSAAKLADALKISRRGKEAKATKKAAPPWQCECGREVRVSKKAAEEGPIVCGLCSTEFQPVAA